MVVFRLAHEINIVRSMIRQERDPAAKRKLKAYLDKIKLELESKF
jgi:hypothetical protein